MNAGILRGILAVLGLYDSRIVTECGLELVIGLRAQLVSIAEEEGGLGKLPGLAQAPKQIGGDDRLSGSSGKRKQDAGSFAVLMAMNDLFEGCTDGCVLIIAGLGPCGAVQLKEDCGLGLGNVDTCIFGIASRESAVMEEILEGPSAVLQPGGEIVLAI